MRILGIDPGTAICGYGVVDIFGNKLSVVNYGAVLTDKDLDPAQRLLILHEELSKIIEIYKPEIMAVEELFFNKNARTVMTVSQARGVILLTGEKNGLLVREYTPIQVKLAVVGYGRATKEQVTLMVQRLLNIKEKPKPDDVADALAVAICAAHSAVSNYWQKK
ncbi:crossover junction endodeoxyribonuclease RuvC [Succinispira mobilis]|uniref:crossover junction endodeoxyribonuclease RuvC n=1 Tax=Succinispira mobilis TaxID=78120 RepID=UPI000368BA38|nr:crossover junction endodeoxyribonuclease RuvC [Succinispira mobilis]